MKRAIFIAGLLIAACAGQALAYDQSGNYAVIGVGGESCGAWLQDHREANAAWGQALGWIGGFVTRFNATTDGANDFSEGTDIQGVIAWMDNYCGSHPLAQLNTACTALVAELLERQRAKNRPR